MSVAPIKPPLTLEQQRDEWRSLYMDLCDTLRARTDYAELTTDALRSIRAHCLPQPSALAAAIVATCDSALAKNPASGSLTETPLPSTAQPLAAGHKPGKQFDAGRSADEPASQPGAGPHREFEICHSRVELGCAGHFICSDRCRWRRHTQVGPYRISSVGDFFPDKNGPRDRVGGSPNAYFETMVFETTGQPDADNEGCGCAAVREWLGLDCERYATAGEAQAGHERYVEKYRVLQSCNSTAAQPRKETP